jgi:hypothetical protein
MPNHRFHRYTSLCLLALASAGSLSAQSDSARGTRADSSTSRALSGVKVTGRADDLRGIASTASQGRIGAADLRLRPLMREGELLETVPGLVVTQHSGDGKANQYFIRGFNLDHGTDFQTRVEGMPINMPSHAHGQGYTDLNFLIPEFVDHIEYRLGVSHADLGDFGSAGGAEFHLIRRLDRAFSSLSAGEDGLARAALGTSARAGDGDLLLGGELKSYDGPWMIGQRLRKASGIARYTLERGTTRFSLLGLAYRNSWNAPDQIPLRAVASGHIPRFGQVDGSGGGETQRYSLSANWNHIGSSSVLSAQLFGVYSDLDLFSNFTYFLDNPDGGDQFNQRERRVVVGANVKHTRQLQTLGAEHALTLGIQHRSDIVSPIGLYRTQLRQRVGTVRADALTEWGTGLFVEAQSRWRPWLRSTLGLRGDGYLFDVHSDRPENSGRAVAGIVSPKGSVVVAPSPDLEIYLSAGTGFHSNDARGSTITVDPASGTPAERTDPLVRSRGAEIGVRANPVAAWRSTLAAWGLSLESELLFVGDGGSTEASNASRRRGVTWANYYRPIPRLAIDTDVSLARARFAGVPRDERSVPGAVERVIAAGLTWNPDARGAFGAIRVRHFGAYPLIEDNSVRAGATTLLNANAGVMLAGARIQLTILNLLDQRASDIQYYYVSRLPDEPQGGMRDVHFHPVEPRQLRLSLGWGR